MKFGKYESVEDFLVAFADAKRSEFLAEIEGLGLEAARSRMRRRKERDVVEVRATVAEYLGTESSSASHQHIMISVLEIADTDPDVQQDLDRVIAQQERVFVSVRYGDRQGLEEPVPDIDLGVELRIRGEWIPKEKAYAHGGEKLSVLHFTHQPIGFICNPSACYS